MLAGHFREQRNATLVSFNIFLLPKNSKSIFRELAIIDFTEGIHTSEKKKQTNRKFEVQTHWPWLEHP